MQTSPLKHWALLGYLVLVWGFAFALIAVALDSLHPTFIVWCRLWMGAVVMWGVWRWKGGGMAFGGRLVAPAGLVECGRQHHSFFADCLGRVIGAVCRGRHFDGVDADRDALIGALVIRT